jgi:membrane-associated phospholipid phosphatase
VGWQAQARVFVTNNPATMSPINAARAYALLGVAEYGAVVAADEQLDTDGGRSQFEARRGAVAGASAVILAAFFTTAPEIAAIQQRVVDDGNSGPGGVHPFFTRGVAVGRAWATDLWSTWAQNDGFTAPWTGTIPVGPGFWTRNPAPVGGNLPPLAGPQFGAMRPYFLTSGSQFHSAAPPAFGSAAFYTDLAEVSHISSTRTAAQLASAVDWNLNVGSETALGRWDEFASQFITENGYDELAAAHVFALTNAAAMDAVIGCWESKFTYFYIRPYQVDQVAYPITTPLGKPNHPSYPSGHSCVSSAAARVIEAFFPEHAAWLDQQVIDAGNSRIYGGLHYRFDITAGQALGRAVANWALAYDRDRGLLAAVR